METNKKILILLFYYSRPELVKNALHSIASSTYSNFEVAFINDSGESHSDHILEFLKGDSTYNKIKQYNINQSIREKLDQGGSIFGKYANQAISDSDSDIVIMLCDDDALVPNYLENLNHYFNEHPDSMWAYSKVKYFLPPYESYLQAEDDFGRVVSAGSVVDLNKHNTPINPDCACDASQVSFRRECFVNKGVWFPWPQTRNLDSAIYSRMYNAWGPCYPTSFYGQCKGVFSDQLGCRTYNDFNINIK